MNDAEAKGMSGKSVLITGGTTGIGRASAQLFYAAGARVVVTGQNPSTLDEARRQLSQEIAVLQSDVRSTSDAERLATDLEQRFGSLDVVFLNAGIAQLAPFEAVSEAAYDEQMAVNVKGVIFTLQKLLRLLRAGSSVIVNTSLADQKGVAMMSVYAATKGAVAAWARAVAVELAPRGIRVNSVCPATILTPIQQKFGLPPEVAEASAKHYCSRIPLGRFGTAEEVASAVLFLASPAASYITGVELPLDGGLAIA